LQYADYAVWQRDWLQGDALKTQLQFWTEHLHGAPAALELATDRPRPAVQTFHGARLFTELPASLADQLRALSRREGVTLFMTLLAAFEVLLWRYSGQDDLVIGVPIAGRNRSELEGLVGLFANTLPLRARLSDNPTFPELLARVRDVALDAYAHQNVPFDKLVEELRPERSLSHSPLFQVVFALENTPQPLEFQGLSMKWLEVDRGTSRADLSLFATDKGAELSWLWEYSTDLFEAETIEKMMRNYRTILERVVENPEERIAYLPFLHEVERRRLLVEWNDERAEPADSSLCIQQLFEAHAAKHPNQIALIFGEERLTYAELNRRTNQLAHRLRRLGVGPEIPVGVCLDRSARMIVALLGILKAGGAYVPLDPSYPADRLEFMLSDSRVAVLLTEQRVSENLPALQATTICLDDWTQFANECVTNSSSPVTPENLAYIIYTSGSTGRPKGVEVTHRTAVHLFDATCDQLGFREGDVYTVVHSSAFDFSVWEIWGSLLQGGGLVVVPLEVVQAPTEFYELLCRERVTILNQTPSALRGLLAARAQAETEWSVRLIVCGGDALDGELAGDLAQLGIPVWNFYGPTENTVWTTCNLLTQSAVSDTSREVQPSPQVETDVCTTSIGRPLAGVQVYLLDKYLQPVPIGVPGELFIGGDGLARGYLGRPELTAEKFIANPFSRRPGARLYRTGDLARYRANGKIEFLGRLDHQIKIRGFRVELGEIETVLNQHEAVAQVVVLLREDGQHDQRLVAYIVPEGNRPSTTELRSFLHSLLPDYMVPSAFVMLDALPLTHNKKVDRSALPPPDYSGMDRSDGAVAPENPIEEMLTAIWARVLGVENLSVQANFFEAGGHSLLATQVMSRIRDAFQIELPLRALFETPTIVGLSDRIVSAIQKKQGLESPPLLPVSREALLPVSFAQQRLWFLDQLEPGSPFYNISRARRLRGGLNVEALQQAISEIVRRHEALRTSFRSEEGTPYQQINECNSVPLPVIDISTVEDKEKKAEDLAAAEISRPFDLRRGPLLRTSLLKLREDDHVLVLTLHHIAADGWSLAVLFRELTSLYDAIVNRKPSPLTALPIQYADYAVWQRHWLQAEALDQLVAYWKRQFAGAPVVLELPTDKSRPAVQTFGGAIEGVSIDRTLTETLKNLSRSEGTTLFMTCLAVFQLLLSRWSGQEDLTVGTDVANRSRVETEGLIGFFTNLLPLRARLSGSLKFTELLRQIKETTLEAYAHQDLPFEKLVEELRPPRDLGRNPLVQVLLVMQNESASEIELPGLSVSRFELPIASSRFDLVLFLSESEDGLEGMWLYNSDLFEPGTITRLSNQYKDLLERVVRDPTARLDSYEIAGADHTSRKKLDKQEQQDAQKQRVSRLRNMRRKGVDLSSVNGVKTRTLQPEQTLPLVIEPDAIDIDLPEWAASNRDFIHQNLLKHGAILFRGFSVDSVSEFERFTGSVCDELFGEYGDLPRERQGGKVYGSTPYPADETILFHNESSHMHRWPMLIWFYCIKAARQGGESPILDSRLVYRIMEPSIRDRFERNGLMYLRNFSNGLDVSWQKFFHTSDKAEVENHCREAGIDFEWKGDNGLRTRQRCDAVVNHPQTGEKVFFNQVLLHHISCLAPAVRESLLSMMKEEDLPRNVYYGDGSRIEDSVVEYLGNLYRENCVSFRWQEHDIAMLNNMMVAHSRNPFVGERKIVVALGNLITKADVTREVIE
ncbi:MAG: amino acid adenylation domain-containing protein, partial [bacterium]